MMTRPPNPPHRAPASAAAVVLATCFLVLSAWGLGQAPPMPADAQHALEQGQAAAVAAMAAYDTHYPDQPLWQEALRLGRQAADLAPGRTEPLRFLAQAYTVTGWWVRAWNSWNEYFGAGGSVDAQSGRAAADAGTRLARARYRAGANDDAAAVLDRVLTLAPHDVEAQGLRGQVALDSGRPAEAVPFLEAATAADAGFQPLLTRARWGAKYGITAADAYLAGQRLAAQRNAEAALASYRDAAAAAPSFIEALRAAAGLAESLGRPKDAADLWQRVLTLAPGDPDAQAGVQRAEGAARWGAEAFDAFQLGRADLAEGQREAARTAFQQALSINPTMAPAEAALGTIALQDDALEEAVRRLRNAVRLDPTDAATRDTLATAEARLARENAAAAAARAAPPATPETAPTAPAATVPPRASTPTPSTPTPSTPTPSTPAAGTPAANTPAPPAAATAPTPRPAAPPATAPASRNAPLTLLDVRLTHRLPESGGSGAFTFLNADDSTHIDLRSPVDYAGGRVYVRLDIENKPSAAPLRYQLCLIPDDAITVRPACSDPGRLRVTDQASVQMVEPLSAFDGAATVNWRRGLQQILLVLRNNDNAPLDDRYTANVPSQRPDLTQYYPMSVHVRAVLVPPGGTFPGWGSP